MERKYITSDKVGEFVQAMFEAGLYASVDGKTVSVRLSDGSYQFVDIFKKTSYAELVSDIISKEQSIHEVESEVEFEAA